MKDILKEISSCNDKGLLREVIAKARERLNHLNRRGPVRLVLRDGHWYALLADGRELNLGRRLSPADVLRRAQRQPPRPRDFSITAEEANARRQARRQVGRIEHGDGSHRAYYDVGEYDRAKHRWHRWHELATDPLAMAWGISVQGMKLLRKLEAAGFQIEPPEQEEGEPG